MRNKCKVERCKEPARVIGFTDEPNMVRIETYYTVIIRCFGGRPVFGDKCYYHSKVAQKLLEPGRL